ncbi:MAG: short-chain dehydrogenase, partial [Gemmatimonadales bacterium]
MELRDTTVVMLGGSGLVGQAMARRLLDKAPKRLVLVALYEDEVRAAARALEAYRGAAAVDVEWGNVFLPASVARLERSVMLADPAHRALLLNDLLGDLTEEVLERSLLCQLLARYQPDAVVDSINTATAFAYQDTFQSARDLLALARAGAADVTAVETHLLTLTMPQLIRHMQLMVEGLRRASTRAYVKIGTSGTGGMGFNVPYTHSEERPSRTLMTKSAVAGAQSLLLFLMGRTPGAPATIEIKPTATIAWREIGVGPVWRKGKPIALVDCAEPVPLAQAFQDGVPVWRDLGRVLEGVFIDTGENGLFARDEFATVTALGQMEFITPEEVADYVVLELEGRPTGRDIIAALDSATAGPTYRAGVLRAHALNRLDALERARGARSVAYEMLGPPRLTKMLFEAHLCALLAPTVRALAAVEPAALAERAHD